MKDEFKRYTRAFLLGAMIMGQAATAAAIDPGIGVGAPGPGVRRGVGAPGVGTVDPGINQPGAIGNVGVGAPGIGTVDPGLNQPGVVGNVGGVARRSVRF